MSAADDLIGDQIAVVAAFGLGVPVQIVVFAVITGLLLLAARPPLLAYIRRSLPPSVTNTAALVGQEAEVVTVTSSTSRVSLAPPPPVAVTTRRTARPLCSGSRQLSWRVQSVAAASGPPGAAVKVPLAVGSRYQKLTVRKVVLAKRAQREVDVVRVVLDEEDAVHSVLLSLQSVRSAPFEHVSR